MKELFILLAILALAIIYMTAATCSGKRPGPDTAVYGASGSDPSIPPEQGGEPVYQAGRGNLAPSWFGPQQMGSLSIIRGSWLKKEMEQAEEASLTAQEGADTWAGPHKALTGMGHHCRTVNNEPFPRCSWEDAEAYCGGRLPTVAHLRCLQRAECTGLGRQRNPTCDFWFWSSDKTSEGKPRYVPFGLGLKYGRSKHIAHYSVRCQQPCSDSFTGAKKEFPAKGNFKLKKTFR